MARLTQWLMALAGLLTSASMSSCSHDNENEEPRPLADTEQSVAKPVKDMIVDRLRPADDASFEEIRAYEDAMQDNYLSKAAFDAWVKFYTTPGYGDLGWSATYGPPPIYKSERINGVPISIHPPSKTHNNIKMKGLPYQVTDGLDKRIFYKVVHSHFSELRACYENAFERDKNVGSGKVIVSWNIDEAGTVSGVTIKETELHNKRIEDCLVEAISRLRFPKPRGVDSVHVEYPFFFESPTDD